MIKSTVAITLLFSVLLVSGCMSGSDITSLSEIKDNPEQYEGKEIVVEGIVSSVTTTINTPPTAGFYFGTGSFVINDETDDIGVHVWPDTEVDETLKVREAVAYYDGEESDKILISEGDSLRVVGVVRLQKLPATVTPEIFEAFNRNFGISIKASKIQKIPKDPSAKVFEFDYEKALEKLNENK